MEELAAITGGKVYRPETLGELIGRLKTGTAEIEHTTARSLRQSW